ncbi:EF-P beta-lysylation protein EpmB [Halioxenophilus sp. WMMB6]|uniref:EF-P beta-lysylation protein EpmB n=1 Tax=Halioxenophilus sp. WMMB6 TaxID=3073815 RepID=UPI00295E866F|nr:EF-P beta-lysylation protein EpmB [Halioxenophilus sp. WMMB6]
MHIITDAPRQTNSWQQQLQELITDPAELARLLKLPPGSFSQAANEGFGLRLPRAMLSKIEPGNPDDPILRQFLPVARELDAVPGFHRDPLAEEEANPVPGLIHKYHGRVLMMAAGHCAVNCRYCFRRHFSYTENRLTGQNFRAILDYIASDHSITEVILSGGDPLTVSNRQLQEWLHGFEGIGHLQRLRIHTRLPVVIPERLDHDFVELLVSTRLQSVLVLHANHPRELDQPLAQALAGLKQANVTLLNQAVLLKGINDQAETLIELSEALFAMGVLPYYLHLLDRVAGAADFWVPDAEARLLHQALLTALPGYLVPKLVREIAHLSSKSWVN